MPPSNSTPLALCALFCFFFSYLHAQSHHQCGFNLFDDQHSEAWIDKGLKNHSSQHPDAAQFELPIVFHIIQDGNQGSATDADVKSMLDNLNLAFANEGFYNPQFGVDTDISFCLVKQDPNGLPTTGITRTQSPLTVLTAETHDAELKSLIQWDPHCYINVYLVEEIISNVYGVGVRGYANFPSGHGTPTDGIVIETSVAGGGPVQAAILIHEMGHYLGLFHTFRGGCVNNDCTVDGDRICDTPPDNSTAPSECEDPINSCSTDAQSGLPNDVPDLVTNYMDYGYLSCRNNFTQGQSDRMQMAINTQRMSLLGCASCEDPCPTPFTTVISFDSLTAKVNAEFKLWATSPPAGSDFEWYENGLILGSQDTLYITSMMEGERTIVLKVTGADPRCVSYDTITFQVYCDAFVSHNLRDTFCLTPGSVLTFNATGQNLSQSIEWYVDGALDQSGNAFTWNVPTAGIYEIYLIGRNDNCEFVSTMYRLYISCREICGNEIDDDGDGLIDGFDPDCCDSLTNFFFDPCYESCPITIDDAFTSIKRKYTTSGFEYHEAGTPLVGDVDGDGKVEIVGTKSFYINNGTQKVSKNYFIVNGEDGSLKTEFDPGGTWRSFSQQLAIADTDRNGYAEIYSFTRNFTRYDINPDGSLTQAWQWAGGAFVQPSITDIDEDGLVEIVVGNGIYDAQSGRTLVVPNSSINQGGISWTASASGSAVVDVLPDDFCANCAGKELIVGNQVYSVNINRQPGQSSTINLEVQLSVGQDGYTSIADMDLDGDLDAVIIYTTDLPDFKSNRHVIVWDIQTSTLLNNELSWEGSFDRIGQSALGDVTGDGIPEIVVADRESLRCISTLTNTPTFIFTAPNADGSGMACPSLFDFDADGKMEIIHRDEGRLRIFDGPTGTVLFEDNCKSGTGWETPVVADVDGDREAELICSCEGELRAYEPDPGMWAFTRPVWNQRLYYSMNVNDDLTIPLEEQSQHLPGNKSEFNSYIFQYGTKEFKASDLEGEVLNKDCDEDRVIYEIQICNIGPSQFNDILKLRGYNSNPTTQSSTVVFSKDTLINQLRPDSCFVMTIEFDRTVATLYLVLNHDENINTPFDFVQDFPTTGIFECEYANNLMFLPGVPLLSPPNLGPDTSMCDFGAVTLDAGPGYASYLWPDFSGDQSYTAWQPGKHWVQVTDSCGKVYSDTINIVIDPNTQVDLGADVNICQGDSLLLSIGNFSNIQWSPSDVVSCQDCPNVVVLSDTTVTVTVLAETEGGCFSFDSVRLVVDEAIYIRDSAYICQGDSVLFDGIYRKDEGTYTMASSGMGCDTVEVLRVFFNEETVFGLEDTIYLEAGDTYELEISGDNNLIDSYTWQSLLPLSCVDCPRPIVTGNAEGIVSVNLILKNGCEIQLTTYIKLKIEGENVFIPNIFSPNGDNLNDRFKVYSDDLNFEIESMQVYDRWGELIYQEGPVNIQNHLGWNGTFNGQLVKPGVYVISFTGKSGLGTEHRLAQSVTVIY